MKKKTLFLVLSSLASLLLLVSLAGCGSEDTTTVIGKVTAVDGNNITLALGTQNQDNNGPDNTANDDSNSTNASDNQQGNPPAKLEGGSLDNNSNTDNAQGTPPEKPSDNTDAQNNGNPPANDGQTPPTNTDGNNPPDNGNGAPPSGGGGMGHGDQLTLTGEEKTITVSDSTVITIEEMGATSKGNISDISEGDILTVTLSGDDVTTITVQHSDGRAFNNDSANSTTDNTTTDADQSSQTDSTANTTQNTTNE